MMICMPTLLPVELSHLNSQADASTPTMRGLRVLPCGDCL